MFAQRVADFGVILALVPLVAIAGGLLVQRVWRRRPAPPDRLRDLEASNSAILRAIPDLMFVFRRDGTYLEYHVRDTSLLFAPPEAFIGKKVADVMPAPLADVFMTAIERASAGTEPVIVEYELPMPEVRYYETRLVSIDADRVLSIVRDVTDVRRVLQDNWDLAGRLIASQEVERTRIARDLHDGVSQEVAALSIDLTYLRQPGISLQSTEAQRILRETQERTALLAETLRALAHGLHSSILQHVGLAAGLQSHCNEVERVHHMDVKFHASGDVEPASHSVALALFRVVQEALVNAARHGRARQARVSLVRGERDIVLSVSDDGVGFDTKTGRRNGGLGLLSIEERARLIHGKSTVSSRPAGGTSVVVRVPVAVFDDGGLFGAAGQELSSMEQQSS